MKFLVSSILRHIEDENFGGKLGIYDWDKNTLEWDTKNTFPLPFCARSDNPRGGLRGYKSILKVKDETVVVNNDSLIFFNKEMKVNKILSHPAWTTLHSLTKDKKYMYLVSSGSDTYSKIDKNYTIQVIEPLADENIHNQLNKYLLKRGRKRNPYNPEKDYRERLEEDTLHINYVVPVSENRLLGFFNSLNMFIQLEPTFEILWAPSLEGDVMVNMPIDYPGLNCPHDIYEIEPNIVLINSSRAQRVYTFNLLTKELSLFFQADHKLEWLRGLEVINNHIFIGTGRGTILEIDYLTKKLITEKEIFRPFENREDMPYSIFGIAKV